MAGTTSKNYPATPAIRRLRDSGIDFTLHSYKYEEHGGTRRAASELHVDENQVIKTLVMEDERRAPLIILMHGDRQVSTKNLARALGAKSVQPCDPATAQKHTGYQVGGTSPFGTKKQLPVYIEESILELPKIYVNAGKRGLLAEMSPEDLAGTLKAVPVRVAIT